MVKLTQIVLVVVMAADKAMILIASENYNDAKEDTSPCSLSDHDYK